MATFETHRQVYMFYQETYQSNADYLEAIRAHPRVSEAHNGAVGYHPRLSAIALQEKHIITRNTGK